MNYIGQLFGLHGKTPIPLYAHSEEYDRMEEALKIILNHPDATPYILATAQEGLRKHV